MANFTIRIANSCNIAGADDIYVLGKGIDPTNPGNSQYASVESYLQFDSGGVGTLVQVATGTTSATYSYKLSQFPLTNGAYVLQVPPTTSGRIYLSIGQALALEVVVAYDSSNNPVGLTVAEPDPYNLGDPNYYTLYDKIEYTYNSDGVWIDTTAVDFFALPLSLEMDGTTVGLTQTRAAILTRLQTDLTGEWAKLVLPFTTSAGTTILRVVAPNKAIGRSPDSANFDESYLAPYISAVFNYYESASLGVDCTEIVGTTNPDFTGTVSSDGTTFTFTDTGQTSVVISPQPASNDVFGAGGALTAVPGTAQSVIVRDFAAAMNAGLLPAADGTTLSSTWFADNKNSYYTDNPLLNGLPGGPWYNLYASALHSFGEPIYAFAYDDVLGQDSTLHTTNPADVATVTLGDMTGTPIPDLTDPNVYTVTFMVGKGCSGSIEAGTQTYDLAYGPPVVVPGVKSPFALTYGPTASQQQYQVTVLTRTAVPTLGMNMTVDGTSVTVALPGA